MHENDAFDRSARLAESLEIIARENDIDHETMTGKILHMVTGLVSEPKSSFPTPPTYRRVIEGESVAGPGPKMQSSHGFFDVVKARASRRDFGDSPLSLDIMTSILAWTLGQREETIAYDWRGAPLRYCASAGGLASVDGYCLALNVNGLAEGSYYYDYQRGLVQTFIGAVTEKIAAALPSMTWLEKAAAIVVLVGNPERVDRKYGVMASKLCLTDAGVAAGHLELVATALETRACILGSLPVALLSETLVLEPEQVPLVSIAIGSRT